VVLADEPAVWQFTQQNENRAVDMTASKQGVWSQVVAKNARCDLDGKLLGQAFFSGRQCSLKYLSELRC
jgi:hypothetical protein